jgi:oxalate---CoA ligase
VSESGLDDFLPLERHATRTPAAIALSAPEREPLTYRELAGCVRTARRELAGAGFRPGEVAAVALPNGPALITAFLAISGTGACAPLNPALQPDEYREYLSRLGARTVIVQEGASSTAASAALTLGMQVMRIRAMPDATAGVLTLDAAGTARPGRSTDAALLLFTSATTGTPKLVPLTRENLGAMASRDIRALELSERDRLLSFMPLFHLLGLASVLAQLFCGGTVISTSGFSPASFLGWLDRFRPTWFTSNATLNTAILALARDQPDVFRRGSLRLIRSSGAVPEPRVLTLLEEAVGAPVLHGYGLTETGGVTRNTTQARKPRSAGRTSGLEVGIMDALGNLLPAESEGEIAVRGPSVTSGYLDDPEANQAAFRDGWFRTGDLGRLDGEGYLFITGRLKEMIDRGGEKIIPEEVDAVLRAHPALEEAAAFAVAHRTLGEDVAAAVVLRDGATASELELRSFAATRLARFKVPRRIVFIDRIPRTATGKPKRALLAEQFQSLMAPQHDGAAPAPESVEGRLAEIWRRTMDRTRPR